LQAEANLHAASAQIGIAIANRLPNITLTADAGSTALSFDKLFSSGTGFWGLGAAATAPLFQGGHTFASRARREGGLRRSGGTISQHGADRVSKCRRHVDRAGTGRRGFEGRGHAADDAQETLDLSQRQWKDGYISFLALLSAEQAYHQARINLVQAQANRYADTAALFQALGGGWWHRADLTKDKK
jgi:outer membrane protein TolC